MTDRHPMLIDTDQYNYLLDCHARGILPAVTQRNFTEVAFTRRTVVQKQARKGYVYLVQSPTSAYKIGKTTKPDDRLYTFKVKLPFEVDYVCLIPTDDMRQLERDLHTRYADKRVGGEWFVLSREDVEAIKELATP